MLPSFAPVLKMSATLRGAKQPLILIKRFQRAKNLRRARCSPFVISKVFAARMRKLITARARKNKRTARMLTKTIRYPFKWISQESGFPMIVV